MSADYWDGRTATASGQPITCDGCRARIERVTAATMVHPVRRPEVWPSPPPVFIVCGPMPDGSQPCLDLAILEESLDPPPGPDCGCASCRTGAGRHFA